MKKRKSDKSDENNNHETLNIIDKFDITCAKNSLTWDKSVYREESLSGMLSQTEFDAIMDEASRILGQAIEKRE